MAVTLVDMSVALLSVALVFAMSFMFEKTNDSLAKFMRSLPTVGRNKGWFSSLRVRLASVFGSREMAAEGYNLFSVRGLPFVLPSLGSGTAVILPPSKLDLLNKPDKKVGAWKFQIDVLQPKHTIGSQEYYETTMKTAFAMVHKRLSRNVEGSTDMIFDELSAGFDKYFGKSSEWTTINVFDAVSRVTVRAANRMFFGTSLSQNDEFLEDLLIYITSVFQSAGMIAILPYFLRSLLGPFLVRKPMKYVQACKRHLLPLVAQRIESTRRGRPVPNDFMQWLIEEYRSSAPAKLDADHVSQSLLILSIQSAFGTSFTLTNCMLDLYSSVGLAGSIESLRQETSQRLFHDGRVNTGEAVNYLHRIDSCLRESMRVSSFSILSLFRSIDDPQGVDYDAHTKLPTGTRIGFAQQAIHHDDTFYPDAKNFDPFRFSRPFEAQSIRPSTNDRTGTNDRQIPVHHINQHFLTWGYGKHACPGRVFASNIMRLAIAYIVEKYDIEGIPARPPSQPMLNTTLPPTDATIRVRWRGTTT